MEPFVLKDEELFLIQDWMNETTGLVAGFTTKKGGTSNGKYTSLNVGFHVDDTFEAVCDNRKKISKLINFPINHWISAQQTHDVHIQRVTKKDRGMGSLSYHEAFKETDGFFTFDSGVLLILNFADCVPLYFYAPKEKAIGIAHAGWKGSVHGIGVKMIDVFKEEGIEPNNIFATIGPSICEKCYIVDDRVVNLVENALEHVEKKPYNLISGNQYYLNLQELNRQLLLKAGLPEQNIQGTNLCTSCHEEHFFSHRRDKAMTGRMMSFIGWKEDPIDS
ncbi:peptidoglycan editing factor PgeF [Cytobacillus sp. FJAT-54145]|uniref:Purine nucleoside phosphorylase n=1 Tax=Cytobacillus spartinae TaxID=3299023 RepID=A0ABW6K5G6_9BACI